MKLDGVDGGDLFGFMAALGVLYLADRADRVSAPRLWFEHDGHAMLDWGSRTHADIVASLLAQAKEHRTILERDFAGFARPGDFAAGDIRRLAADGSPDLERWLAGLVCTRGDDEVYETTLCAANGAGHQNLLKSMRDILSLVEATHLEAALFARWKKDYVPPKGPKPTLRLDPADERLYALRFSNPTTAVDFRTELGAQALAIFGFPLLPVVPRTPARATVTVSSRRERNKVYFEWSLWAWPATLATVRSHLVAGTRDVAAAQSRGAFAAFRAARVSGDKGKLSFAPTEGLWSDPTPITAR